MSSVPMSSVPKSSELSLSVNGASISVPPGTTVAVAVLIAGQQCRTSVSGEPRGPLCGIGVCYECRVAINGTPHRRSCQTLCEEGMDVRTHE
jgi:predicted molibdopterin-dependent oxidoreductase YjgC